MVLSLIFLSSISSQNYPMIEAKPPAAIPMTALSANEGGLGGGARASLAAPLALTFSKSHA
jgi:hypothetical protein